ncbi:hypothetical protein [Winogradskyella sp.]|uniref:hypothetical protein n=1 Tax=Winogradskyella sp. TaxID=1883156 RepID=UPI003BACD329
MNNNYLYLLVFVFCTQLNFAQVTTIVDNLNAIESTRTHIHDDIIIWMKKIKIWSLE